MRYAILSSLYHLVILYTIMQVETSACEPDNLLQGRRLIEIEAEIEKACLEEDYDRAGTLLH